MPVTMTVEAQDQGIASGVLESVGDEKIVLKVPGTSYQLHFTPAVPASDIDAPVGKRIKGTVHAQALRMFVAKGGGRFIEPIWGEPPIVAGFVKAVDQPNRRVLVDVSIPIWMTLEPRQPADMFKVGQLVNCYVQSGTRFRPV